MPREVAITSGAALHARDSRTRRHRRALPIDGASAAQVSKLEVLHRDPFGRILVCQAIEHALQIVTVDPVIAKYPVRILTLA